MLRKISTLFFAVCLFAVLLLPVSAAEKSNLLLIVDDSEVEAGDTFTVTLRNNDMNVVSFAGGIRFDKDALTCEKIVGIRDGEETEECWLHSETKWISALALSSLADSAKAGTVGFAFANANEAHYQEGTLFVATFRAKKSGVTTISVYETADGTDTYNSNESATYDVTVTGDTPADPTDPGSTPDTSDDPTASATPSPAPIADPVAKGLPLETILLIAVPVLIAAAAVVVVILAKKKKQ